jgi:type IV secretion system protein VirD4
MDPTRPASTLYLLGDHLSHARLAPVFLGLLDELTRAWFARAGDLMKRRGAIGDAPVLAPDERLLLVIDEAADIAPLPDLDKIAASGGSHGVVLMLCLQDLSQLRQRLGEQKANSVVNNCQTRIITHGMGDVTTLKLINELIGQAEVQTTAVTTIDGRAQLSVSTVPRDILTTAELRELALGRAIVINGAEPPVHAYLLDRNDFTGVAVPDQPSPAEASGYPPPEKRWPFEPR